MTTLLLTIITLLCLSLVIWGMLKKDRMIQFPTLAALVVGFQLLPQFYIFRDYDWRLSVDPLDRVILMTILCLAMTAVGYSLSVKPSRKPPAVYDMRRLLMGGAVLVIVGQMFGFLINSLPGDMLEGQWSGLPVRYLFFAMASNYGFALMLILYMRWRSKWALLLALPGLYTYIELFLFQGRRTPTAMCAIMILSSMWFNRKKTVPRPVLLLGMCVFALFVLNINEYRGILKSKKADKVKRIMDVDYWRNLDPSNTSNDNSEELMNAVNYMDAVSVSGKFNWGAGIYNGLIATYVPRQIVGEKFKKSLMIDTGDPAFDLYRYRPQIGSSMTGISEAYQEFWYAGCILFLIVGCVVRVLWERSMAGYVGSQVVYVSVLALLVGVFPSSLRNFTTPWLHILIFLGPVLWVARTRGQVGREVSTGGTR